MGEVDDEIHPMLADLRIIWCASTAHLTELELGINKMNRGALCSGEAEDDSEGPGVREQHTSANPLATSRYTNGRVHRRAR